MLETKTLIVRFNNDLKSFEIPLFRGAVISASGYDDVLYHNHQGDNYRYSYPLIQYKRIDKKASIFCIGSGTESIGKLFCNGEFEFQIGERKVQMEIDTIKATKNLIQLWQTELTYRVVRWLPLNTENYHRYNAIESLTERITFLEHILTSNLLSMLKGLGIFIEGELTVKITALDEPYIQTYKGVKLMAFNCNFKSNLSIPHYAGIGKNASNGFGIVYRSNPQSH